MISDREPTEQEFQKMLNENPKILVSSNQLQKKIQDISDANLFQYNKDELERLVNE